MMFSRLKYPDLYCCLAKATGLRCFVASQPIISFTHLWTISVQKVAARGQKIFCVALGTGAMGRAGLGHLGASWCHLDGPSYPGL